MSILQEEASLNEIVQLVGKDALSRQRPADAGDGQDGPRGLPAAERLYGRGLATPSYERQDKLLGMILQL